MHDRLRLRRSRSPSWRNIVQTLRTFFEDAIYFRWVSCANPLVNEGFKSRLPDAEPVLGKHVRIHLPEQDVYALLTARDPLIPAIRRVRNVVAIATGARDAELQGLTIADVRLDGDPTIAIERQLVRVGPATIHFMRANLPFIDDGIRATSKPPKRDSDRELPLAPVAARALRWWIDVGWRRWVGRAPNASDPLFPNIDGHFARPDSAERLRDDLARARLITVHRSGGMYTAHALRRTFATLLEGQGVQREHISGLLGHAQHGVAARHYIAKLMEPVAKLPLPADVVLEV